MQRYLSLLSNNYFQCIDFNQGRDKRIIQSENMVLAKGWIALESPKDIDYFHLWICLFFSIKLVNRLSNIWCIFYISIYGV